MVVGISQTLISTAQTSALACWEGMKQITESIIEIARKGFNCIYEFFASIDLERTLNEVVAFVFCVDGNIERPAYDEGFIEAQYPVRNLSQRPLYAHTVSEISVNISEDMPNHFSAFSLNNSAVNLEGLKEVLRTRRGRVQISKKMTIANFIELCKHYPVHFNIQNRYGQTLQEGDVDHIHNATKILHEQKRQHLQGAQNRDHAEREASEIKLTVTFPWQRKVIGKWAMKWAKERELSYDPTSKFSEVIQSAFQYREQIDGGTNSSSEPEDYHPTDPEYYSREETNNFTYIIYTLLGFQALDNPPTIGLFYCLDDLSQRSSKNFAYGFASNLSRIFTYPRAGNNDIRHKLQLGLGACWTAYQTAKQQDCILDLFNDPPSFFGEYGERSYCFDIRVTNLQKFTQRKSEALFNLDFAPKCNYTDSLPVKVGAHVHAFRNIQIRDYVEAHLEKCPRSALTYPAFKALASNMGQDLNEDCPHIQATHPVETDRSCSKEFLLPISQIPQESRVEGSVIALRNPHDGQWYKVEVTSVSLMTVAFVNHSKTFEKDHYNLDRFARYLETNGQPLREIALATAEHPRFDSYHVRFDKRRSTITVSRVNIPDRYRQIGQVLAIYCRQDGKWYQAKVVGVEPRILLDLSGHPIPRQRWAEIIEEQVLM